MTSQKSQFPIQNPATVSLLKIGTQVGILSGKYILGWQVVTRRMAMNNTPQTSWFLLVSYGAELVHWMWEQFAASYEPFQP